MHSAWNTDTGIMTRLLIHNHIERNRIKKELNRGGTGMKWNQNQILVKFVY